MPRQIVLATDGPVCACLLSGLGSEWRSRVTGTDGAQVQTDQNALDALAIRAARRYPIPGDVRATLINISENVTYRLDDLAGGKRWALRVHREGYHSRTAIASELAWLKALGTSGAANVPEPI